jgi:hypothetical protein
MSAAEMIVFIEEYQRLCADGEIDDSRLRFKNRMKMQSLLVIRRICSDAYREVYIGSLFDVAMDL